MINLSFLSAILSQEYTSITLVLYFMLSNDYSMSAKMLMHPNSVFSTLFKRTPRRELRLRFD